MSRRRSYFVIISQIKQDWRSLSNLLEEYQSRHSEDFYYKIRESEFKNRTERAAQFVYLNRTCWNGLYRVNLKGQFNVPIGTKNKVVMDSDDFERISKSLSRSKIISADFCEVIEQATNDDFVFVDPPYCLENGKGFTKYNKNTFTWGDQLRLKDCLKEASQRGVKFLMTNIAHESTIELFSELGEHIFVDRKSVISGENRGRGRYQEIVVRNYL